MDSALNKITLYSFLGIFMSGMFTVLIGISIRLPYIDFSMIDSDVLKILLFFLESYLIGLVLRDVSLIFDYQFVKVSRKAISSFLNKNDSFVSNLELADFRKMANIILKRKDENTDFNFEEHEYVYQHCKALLKTSGKDDEFNTVNAEYAMRRTMTIMFLSLTVCYIFSGFINPNNFSIWYIIILIAFAYFFYIRMKTYSRYRIRTLMRYCRILYIEQGLFKEKLS